jgi:polyisoprenoid-binding protein YceI
MSRTLLALAALAAPLAAADYAVDLDHSNALFAVAHMGASQTWGRFNKLDGSISFDAADPAKSKVAITIQAASVDTKVPKMEEHLRTPDFFDAKQYPTLGFTSKSWKKLADAQYEVAGDLTIHGVTKPLTVTVRHTGSGKHAMNGKELIGFETQFAIKRSDFGMTNMVGPVGDEVRIIVAIEGVGK